MNGTAAEDVRLLRSMMTEIRVLRQDTFQFGTKCNRLHAVASSPVSTMCSRTSSTDLDVFSGQSRSLSTTTLLRLTGKQYNTDTMATSSVILIVSVLRANQMLAEQDLASPVRNDQTSWVGSMAPTAAYYDVLSWRMRLATS